VLFFQQEYEDFNEARLSFSQFLGHLFDEIARHIKKEPSFANPAAWRGWLDEGSNRHTLYHDVLEKLRVQVCGYFCIHVAEMS
jgi:hypothetical protein